MTEHLHTNTIPGEPVAPEVVDHPIKMEPGGGVQSDDINVTLVTMVGIISVLLLFLIVTCLQAWFYTWSAQEQEAKIQPSQELQEMRDAQRAKLTGTETNTMSIDKAMDTVIADLHGNEPTPALLPR